MNENLNLVEILKDCPEGTKLYSTIYGDVELAVSHINDYERPIEIKIRDNEFGEGFYMIVPFTNDGRLKAEYPGECTLFPSREQRDWSKFNVKSNNSKFDPKTLKPFDKVLVRYDNGDCWCCALFSNIINGEGIYKYQCVSGAFKCCIPYNEDTEHLIATTDDAPEFYRYWDD